jgi:hypothetical protein
MPSYYVAWVTSREIVILERMRFAGGCSCVLCGAAAYWLPGAYRGLRRKMSDMSEFARTSGCGGFDWLVGTSGVRGYVRGYEGLGKGGLGLC